MRVKFGPYLWENLRAFPAYLQESFLTFTRHLCVYASWNKNLDEAIIVYIINKLLFFFITFLDTCVCKVAFCVLYVMVPTLWGPQRHILYIRYISVIKCVCRC